MQLVKVRWGKRWSEREDLKLEDPTLESKSQETPMPWPYRNLKIGIFQIDTEIPGPRPGLLTETPPEVQVLLGALPASPDCRGTLTPHLHSDGDPVPVAAGRRPVAQTWLWAPLAP